MSSKHWPAMQAVEALRHRAELIEERAAGLPGPRAQVLLRIAARMRELAEEEAALALAEEMQPGERLPRAV